MRLLHLTLITTLLFLLTACGNDGGSSPADPTDTAGLDTDVDATDFDTDLTDTSLDAAPDTTTDTESDTPDDSPITVSGRVVTVLDIPLPGVQVGLLPDRVTITDDEGRFEFADVQPPYDIITITRDTSTIAVLYEGLTRPDPSLWHQRIPEIPEADVTVTVDGGLFDESGPPSFNTRVSFVPGPNESARVLLDTGVNTEESGAAALQIRWAGDSTITGRLVALQWESDANGRPTTYTGFGFSPVITISAGDMLTDVSVSLDQPISDKSIEFDATTPSGFGSPTSGFFATFQGRGGLNLINSVTTPVTLIAPASDSLATHALTNASEAASGDANILQIDTNIDANTTVDIALDPFRGMLNPQNNASGIDTGYQFTWEADADDVTVTVFEAQSSGPFLLVITDDPQFTLPDLRPFAFALPADTAYGWRTFNISPFDHVDDAATPRFDVAASIPLLGGVSAQLLEFPFTLQTDDARTFRTAP